MLARHLLFLATRRPHNALVSLPTESVPAHVIAQPPPYISPPQPEDSQKYKEILKEPPKSQAIFVRNEKQASYEHQKIPQHEIYQYETSQNIRRYEDEKNAYNRQALPNYTDYQRAYDRQTVQMHNARNRQFNTGREGNQQFYTLPTRRPQREIEPPRSVTPDITRGLGRGLSAMHMLARHGQKQIVEHESNRFAQVDPTRRSMEQLDAKNRLVQGQQSGSVVDVRNRFVAPLSLSALGYRFFASSPVAEPLTRSTSTEALKHNPISPIGHSYGTSFKSSTPAGRSTPTVAERLAINCSSPAPSSGRSTPIQTSSGRSTPTNLILSPTKSTMSNEELFAAIHKSKRRLNIRDDCENLSPYGSMNSLVKVPAGTRHSWSPDSQKPIEITQTVQSPSATSRLDFKRLLLQQSTKTGPTRLSAAEQLKLSRQQCQYQQQSSPISQQTPLTKVLSPRSVWRFQTPRTDVLSSTIIEDTAAEEKAMKPSPENTSPISRINSRRQLDLCSDLPSRLQSKFDEDGTTDPNKSTLITDGVQKLEFNNERRPTSSSMDNLENKQEILTGTNKLSIAQKKSGMISDQNAIAHQRLLIQNRKIDTIDSINSAQNYSQSTNLSTNSQSAIDAFESRRISNQLARAQFLASMPMNNNQGQNACFKNRFRARSESPQDGTNRSVARSPTLETAL